MLQYFTVLICNKCITQVNIQITKEDFDETIGDMPKIVWETITKNGWKDLPDDKHICSKCQHSWGKMIDKCNKIKLEYWGDE